jgi:hypothetical protein
VNLAAFAALAISLMAAGTPPPNARAIQLPGSLPSNQWTQAACGGHGRKEFGDRCTCDSYWTGANCDTPDQPPDCGAHGKAAGDRCVCDPGWRGDACQKAPLVCKHGQATHGKCACEPGWSGDACDKGS